MYILSYMYFFGPNRLLLICSHTLICRAHCAVFERLPRSSETVNTDIDAGQVLPGQTFDLHLYGPMASEKTS